MAKAPFTDEELMVIAQLSYRDPYIKVKGYNLSLADMLEHEKSYLESSLGKDKRDLIESLINKTKGKDYYIVASTNDKHGTGFSALAIEGPDKGTVTVAVRGTEKIGIDNENSTRDTYTDAQLGFESETNQQKKMDDFMKQFENYDSIYLTGHSLGGNLAVSGAVGFEDPNKIKGVVTFNCPGQNVDYRTRNAFRIKKIEGKVKNYQNEKDWVSDINVAVGEIIIIKSNGNKDNHNMIGIDMTDGGFTRVKKKDTVHIGGYILINTIITAINFNPKAERVVKMIAYGFLQVCLFVNMTEEKIKKVANWLKDKYQKFRDRNITTTQITLDTYKLTSYSDRLKSVNKRLKELDNRLDSLYWKVGLLDLWDLMQADLLTSYSARLLLCASYLSETAKDFSDAEKNLTNEL